MKTVETWVITNKTAVPPKIIESFVNIALRENDSAGRKSAAYHDTAEKLCLDTVPEVAMDCSDAKRHRSNILLGSVSARTIFSRKGFLSNRSEGIKVSAHHKKQRFY